ncbi:Malonyl CoA-acyl carrier protein transacylase [Geodia barretti]|uniref:[acyl-carrier-protein] S-malonyltransferase n=1 Tax=Geodia barretti TaxID=519541 RepID=A0AA35R2E1_GEOBA|nr:Malonyl CoA-acyl carrier protein transacylase [Geodia barretti]
MGLELSQEYTTARAAFDEADTILNRKLSQLCFEGPAEALKQTENTQLAILTCSVAALRVLSEHGIAPKAVAGHSLGEYSALVAADVLAFSDALRLVEYRAKVMAEASQRQDCTMAAILGLDETNVTRSLRPDASTGVVQIANYNCPGQLIVSGDTAAVERVMDSAKAAGARRCLRLEVSGAFHSSLMGPAKERLQTVIDDFQFNDPSIQVAANVTGNFVQTADEVTRLLIAQVTSAVQWEKSIRTIGAAGISHFVEVGPGTVLSGMVRRTLPEAICLNVEDTKSFDKLMDIAYKG